MHGCWTIKLTLLCFRREDGEEDSTGETEADEVTKESGRGGPVLGWGLREGRPRFI